MSDTRKIDLYDGITRCGEIELTSTIDRSTLIIKYLDSEGRSGDLSGHDFFYILSELRGKYHKLGCELLCKGSLIDVFSSGLASESSHGEMVYEIDEYSGEQSIVNIFDGISESELSKLASFNERKEKRRAVFRKLSSH